MPKHDKVRFDASAFFAQAGKRPWSVQKSEHPEPKHDSVRPERCACPNEHPCYMIHADEALFSEDARS